MTFTHPENRVDTGVTLTTKAIDPYPFIFLNLMLSMLAAIQAPIIMMSQNRQAEIDRRDLRFMGDAAAYAAVAMRQAVADSGLDAAQVSNPRTGLIAGSGGGSSSNIVEAADIARSRGVRKIGPTRVPRTMCSTVAACLGTAFRIKGLSYSVSSACAPSSQAMRAYSGLSGPSTTPGWWCSTWW